MIGTHEFHMCIDDINSLRLGELIDMINALSVYKGAAKYKKKPLTYDQIMMLR